MVFGFVWVVGAVVGAVVGPCVGVLCVVGVVCVVGHGTVNVVVASRNVTDRRPPVAVGVRLVRVERVGARPWHAAGVTRTENVPSGFTFAGLPGTSVPSSSMCTGKNAPPSGYVGGGRRSGPAAAGP